VKTLPRKIAVVILTLVLAGSALAGQIQCPGAASNDTGTSPDTTEIITEISTTDMAITVILIITSLPPY